ncbi:hypothetical protein ACQVP6_20305 [Bacillus cereus]|nr:hypothetical protein [Bacillus cereus]MDA2472069.1 hypothetical protein [Bacillus cereus]
METVGCGFGKPSFKQLSKINTSLAAAAPYKSYEVIGYEKESIVDCDYGSVATPSRGKYWLVWGTHRT